MKINNPNLERDKSELIKLQLQTKMSDYDKLIPPKLKELNEKYNTNLKLRWINSKGIFLI